MSDYTGSSPENVREMHQGLKARAAEFGLRMEPPTTLYNTRPAHLLAEYARDLGKVNEIQPRLFRVNFVEGRNLADREVLREVARDAGLDPDAAMAALGSDEYEDRINRAAAEARAYGVTGVPAFIIEQRYRIVGAQPYDQLAAAFRQVQESAA